MVEDQHIDTMLAGSLQKNHIVVEESGGKKELIKIKTIKRVKTGKHGSAKIIITGKDIVTNKNAVLNYTSGSNATIAIPKKRNWVLSDYYGEEEGDLILAHEGTPVSHIEELETIQGNEVDPATKKELETLFNDNSGNEENVISFITAVYPGITLLEDIKVTKRKV